MHCDRREWMKLLGATAAAAVGGSFSSTIVHAQRSAGQVKRTFLREALPGLGREYSTLRDQQSDVVNARRMQAIAAEARRTNYERIVKELDNLEKFKGSPASPADLDRQIADARERLWRDPHHQEMMRAPSMADPILPRLLPFADWDMFHLNGQLNWAPNEGQTLAPVRVPWGFVTDLASVPAIFWSVLPKTGRYAYAAVVHDFLYWDQTRIRGDADLILHTAMLDMGVSSATAQVIYRGVQVAGRSAWNENARLKRAGERRILKLVPPDARVSWAEWRKRPGVFAD